MKLCFAFISSMISLFTVQSSVYDIQVQTIDGNTVKLSSYEGKEIIVLEFDALKPDTSQLRYLDSLQAGSNSIVVIAVPAIDFSGTVNEDDLRKMRDSQGLHILFTKPAVVQKKAGGGQDPLFKWLTYADDNGHFDNEVTEAGEFFIISRHGTLHSQLTKDTPRFTVSGVLSQQIIE